MIDFNEISGNEKSRLVSVSINFLQTITDVCGPEAGFNLWDNLANNISQDLKNEVLMKMLTIDRNYITINGQPNIRNPNNLSSFIDIIKCIREYADIGLKEAKDTADAINENITMRIAVDPAARHDFIRDLTKFGLNVS